MPGSYSHRNGQSPREFVARNLKRNCAVEVNNDVTAGGKSPGVAHVAQHGMRESELQQEILDSLSIGGGSGKLQPGKTGG